VPGGKDTQESRKNKNNIPCFIRQISVKDTNGYHYAELYILTGTPSYMNASKTFQSFYSGQQDSLFLFVASVLAWLANIEAIFDLTTSQFEIASGKPS
jgi:hypothetical protein